MANVNIIDLPQLTDPVVGDEIEVYDASASANKRLNLTYLVRSPAGAAATVTGGGVIALGGFTLTVPATGTAALLGTAQTFTATKTFTPASGRAIDAQGASGQDIARFRTAAGVESLVLPSAGGMRSISGTLTAAASSSATYDINLSNAIPQLVMVMVGGYGNGVTAAIAGLWLVSGNLGANDLRTTIAEIHNTVTATGSMTLAWQSAGVLRLTLTNTNASQAKTANVSWLAIH